MAPFARQSLANDIICKANDMNCFAIHRKIPCKARYFPAKPCFAGFCHQMMAFEGKSFAFAMICMQKPCFAWLFLEKLCFSSICHEMKTFHGAKLVNKLCFSSKALIKALLAFGFASRSFGFRRHKPEACVEASIPCAAKLGV